MTKGDLRKIIEEEYKNLSNPFLESAMKVAASFMGNNLIPLEPMWNSQNPERLLKLHLIEFKTSLLFIARKHCS